MGKGELEKRSVSAQEIATEVMYGTVDVRNTKWVSVDNIEEAKKEFPQRKNTLFQGLGYQQRMEKDSEYISKLLDWKQKWLGE